MTGYQEKEERSSGVMATGRNETMASGVIQQIKREKAVFQKALFLSLAVNLIQSAVILFK